MMSTGWSPRVLPSDSQIPVDGDLARIRLGFGLNSGQPEVVINRQLRLAI